MRLQALLRFEGLIVIHPLGVEIAAVAEFFAIDAALVHGRRGILDFLSWAIATSTAPKKTTIKSTANPIQSGAVIHHHDQSITPVNFKTRKTRNSALKKPIPDEFEFELLIV